MGNQITTAELTSHIAGQYRVMILGDLAVIAHGYSRPTFDANI